MAVKPIFGRFHRPGSLAQLTRGRGWNSELVGFLLPLARRDYFFRFYDWDEDTMNTDWTTANSGGVSAASFTVQAAEDGTIQGDTGTDDNGVVQIKYDGVIFDAARKPGMEVRIKFDTVTTNPYAEIGFSDAPTSETVIKISDIDTPALAVNGLTDAVIFGIDPDQTLKSPALVTVGTTDAVAKAIIGASPGSNPFTAATYATVLIQAYANAAYAVLDDNLETAGRIATGPDTAKLMRPYILVATRLAGTAVFPEIDYIVIWKERV